MKTLRIRFIEVPGGNKTLYEIQVKKWNGWQTQGYSVNMGYGWFYELYTDTNKENLLNTVLDKEFKTVKKFVTIIEYPTLKRY